MKGNMLSQQILDKNTSEESIAELVDAVKRSPEGREILVALLPERIPLYQDRSTNETMRIRGYILAAFEQVGLSDAALPYVLEELESGRDAYLVAAAARALRGLGTPTSRFIPFLLKAIENIKFGDDALTFDSYKPQWPLPNYTTALKEIFKTFAWLGPEARPILADLEAMYQDSRGFAAPIRIEIKNALDRIRAGGEAKQCGCCHNPVSVALPAGDFQEACANVDLVADIELEDQDGNRHRYRDFFNRTPAIVVFFYTRCDNPNKCSLTITKLARLQQAIRAAGLEGQLKTAAITYDPGYDLPARLKAYGIDRGVSFGDDDRFFRTRTGFKELQEYFELGVNFNGSIVNRHRIELFILDGTGRIAGTFARAQWDVDEVLQHARGLLPIGS